MKNVRRYVALVIIMCLVSSFTFPASASEVKTNALDGMDRYFTLTQNGTISFDTAGALDAGYTETAVGKVLERINFMNGLVLSGKAYINADFNAVEGQPMVRNTNAQIVHNWDGTTDVYLSMAEAEQLLEGIELAELGLDYFTILAEFPNPVQPYVAPIFLLNAITLGSYRNQIENAMEAGTGIVMHIWTADSTGMQYYTFWAQ